MVGPGGALAAAPHHLHLILLLLCFLAGDARASPATDALRHASPRAAAAGLCQQLLLPQGYLCTEHTVQTDDGFLLSIQHIQHGKNGVADNAGPPVFLQHGLFQLFWDWSWQDLAEYDLLAMLSYVYTVTQSKILYVGHSQMLNTMGIHQLNFRSEMGVQILDSLCDAERLDCDNMLSSITVFKGYTSTCIRRWAARP